ncbi:MAG: choline kinase family protein [Candidatus Onthovivens sp.]|nr:choline kinase family protein [Mollicutes bacterium]MDY4857362.1 choline kinase family protein [Candidatus Onthovivens sp.]MDY4936839.1 choline kinase family protein [Candidatus Onthovivens sp.]
MKQKIKSIFTSATQKEIRSSQIIENGFCNENYNINDAFVLRIPKDNADETLNYKHENIVYKTIEPLKISEKVVYFDENTGIKISKFVHNARQYKTTPTNEQITYLAKTLKKLHSSKLKVPFGYQMFYRLSIYKKSLFEDEYIDTKIEKQIIKDVQKIFAKDEMVLCHNDLVQNNLLFKFNGLTLIDWEYSGMNNFYFDLASFISENNLNDEQKEFFLSKYFGAKLNDLKRKKVNIFINFLDLLFYYWGLYYYRKRGDIIYKKIALEKLEHIKVNFPN